MFQAKLKNLAHVLGAIAIAYFTLSCPAASAAPIIPSSLSPGAKYHLIFITSDLGLGDFGNGPGTFGTIPYGNLGGIGNANIIVNTAANVSTALTMGANYRAIISDSTTSAIGLSTFLNGGNSPIYNTQGQLVSPNYASMFQGIATALNNPIRYTEYGVSATFGAWTGTDSNGIHKFSRSNWTGASTLGTRGVPNQTAAPWIDSGTNNLNQALRLYGISEELTVPVPEPGTISLIALGVVLGGHTLRRRRQPGANADFCATA